MIQFISQSRGQRPELSLATCKFFTLQSLKELSLICLKALKKIKDIRDLVFWNTRSTEEYNRPVQVTILLIVDSGNIEITQTLP